MDGKAHFLGALWGISLVGLLISGTFAGFAPGYWLSNTLWIVFIVCAVGWFIADRGLRKSRSRSKSPGKH